MSKLVCCFRRKSGMSLEEFHRYWLEEHGGLALRLREHLSGTRYVQSHTVRGEMTDKVRAIRGTAEPFDGIAEAWFHDDKIEDIEANRAAIVRMVDDEAEFIDLENSVVFFTWEHEIFSKQ